MKEQVTWIKGRHSLKFGMDYLRGIYRRLDYNGAYGTVSFSSAGTGNPTVGASGSDWASFLLGVASGGGFRFPCYTAFFCAYFCWAVLDDFKFDLDSPFNLRLPPSIPLPTPQTL